MSFVLKRLAIGAVDSELVRARALYDIFMAVAIWLREICGGDVEGHYKQFSLQMLYKILQINARDESPQSISGRVLALLIYPKHLLRDALDHPQSLFSAERDREAYDLWVQAEVQHFASGFYDAPAWRTFRPWDRWQCRLAAAIEQARHAKIAGSFVSPAVRDKIVFSHQGLLSSLVERRDEELSRGAFAKFLHNTPRYGFVVSVLFVVGIIVYLTTEWCDLFTKNISLFKQWDAACQQIESGALANGPVSNGLLYLVFLMMLIFLVHRCIVMPCKGRRARQRRLAFFSRRVSDLSDRSGLLAADPEAGGSAGTDYQAFPAS